MHFVIANLKVISIFWKPALCFSTDVEGIHAVWPSPSNMPVNGRWSGGISKSILPSLTHHAVNLISSQVLISPEGQAKIHPLRAPNAPG